MASSRGLVAAAGAVALAALAGVWLLTRATDDVDAGVEVLRAEAGAPVAQTVMPDPMGAVPQPAPLAAVDADATGAVPAEAEPASALIDWDALPDNVVRAQVTGRVIDEAGAPFIGARVIWRSDWETADVLDLPNNPNHTDLDSLPGGSTDAEGRFDFPAPWSTSRWSAASPGLNNRPVLVVQASGMAIHAFTLDDFVGLDHDAGDLVLDVPASTLRAWVMDEAGQPIAGVKGGFGQWRRTEELDEHPAFVARGFNYASLIGDTSGEDGLIELTPLCPSTLQLNLVHPNREIQRIDDVVVGRGEVVDLGPIVMPVGTGIGGTVSDTRGEPVPGAEVYPRRAGEHWFSTSVQADAWDEFDVAAALLDSLTVFRDVNNDRSPALTDADGAFLKTGLPHEAYDLLVGAPGLDPALVRDVPIGSYDLRIVLSDPAVCALAILDRTTIEPVADVEVTAWRRSGVEDYMEESIRTPCEVARGAHALDIAEQRGLPPSDIVVIGIGPMGAEVVVSAPGYATRGYRVPGLAPGEAGSHELTLWRAAALTGRVVDDAGEVVAGGKVSLTPPASLRVTLDKLTTESGADGSFRFDDLTGGDWSLRASGKGYMRSEPEIVHVAPETVSPDHEIVLQREGVILGHLRKPDGTPATGTRVSALRRNPKRTDNSWIGNFSEADAEGSFRLGGLGAGTYIVSADPGVKLDIPVGPADQVELELALKHSPRISGWVRSAGAPLPGAQVVAVRQSAQDSSMWFRQPKPAKTDAAGRYAIELGSEGEWSVHAEWKGGGRSEKQTVSATWGAAFQLDFELGVGRLGGSVVDARDGSVPADVQARLVRDGAAATDWTKTGADGGFDFVKLGAGEYVVEARGGAFATARSETIALEPGGSRTDVRVQVAPGAVIKGFVLGPDGQPDSSWLYLLGDGLPDGIEQHSAKGGVIKLVGLEPGSYRVVVSGPSFEHYYLYPENLHGQDLQSMIEAEATVTLAPGEVRTITLQRQ